MPCRDVSAAGCASWVFDLTDVVLNSGEIASAAVRTGSDTSAPRSWIGRLASVVCGASWAGGRGDLDESAAEPSDLPESESDNAGAGVFESLSAVAGSSTSCDPDAGALRRTPILGLKPDFFLSIELIVAGRGARRREQAWFWDGVESKGQRCRLRLWWDVEGCSVGGSVSLWRYPTTDVYSGII